MNKLFIGKVWCLDLDKTRIVSGGRFGELRVWHIPELAPFFMDDDIQETEPAQEQKEVIIKVL